LSILQLRAATEQPLLSDEEWRAIGCQLKLSGRELDILRYLVTGEKELTIAHRLGISSHTVHTHLHRLYEKLGVSSRLEVIVLIFREYLAHTRQERFGPCNLEHSPSDRVVP
jgi:DNA-binding NarL/FixJ family response regulator